jgi:hypothetical protein
MYIDFYALQNCIQSLSTEPSLYSRSIENHSQHTEQPKLNAIVQTRFQQFP